MLHQQKILTVAWLEVFDEIPVTYYFSISWLAYKLVNETRYWTFKSMQGDSGFGGINVNFTHPYMDDDVVRPVWFSSYRDYYLT